MPREISGLRLARSFITPDNNEVLRVIDFQLGVRQGIAIHSVLGTMMPDTANITISPSVTTYFNGTQTLHLETGSLETIADQTGEDEDTIDSEIFFRQECFIGGNDDSTTEFRSSFAVMTHPEGLVTFPRPIYTARNITHRGATVSSNFAFLGHVILYYVFVEFSLAELGLILARRQ